MGQYTGISVASVTVRRSEMTVARVAESQKFHSGKRLTNGRNSSSRADGNMGCESCPSSTSSAAKSASSEGSNLG